ncbi:MAG: cellulose synthase, partial [Nocardiopsaceae bacterium]|nr:cellulose synthase [Nocardiopsaceae bacterium]
MGYHSIAWLPICAGLTIAGLVLSYLVGRRRGRLAMMRGAAWSLLPIAVYLTGSVEMFWKIGSAIGTYVDGFVFSPVKWAGIAVAGLAALLFAATRGRDRRRAARRAGPRAAGP